MKTGTTKKAFLEAVRKQSDGLKIDRVSRNGEKFLIQARMKQHTIGEWRVKGNSDSRVFHTPQEALNALCMPIETKITGKCNITLGSWTFVDGSGNIHNGSSVDTLTAALKMLPQESNEITVAIRAKQSCDSWSFSPQKGEEYYGADALQKALERVKTKNKQKFSIVLEGKRVPAEIDYWSFCEAGQTFKSAKPVIRGRGEESFLKALDELNKERHTRENTTVLCLCDTKPYRTPYGRILTTWVRIDPACPFLIKKGIPQFENLVLDLSEDEYKVCLETCLAFYEPDEDVLYPIREAAFLSIGRLFDCGGMFKSSLMGDVPLGTALTLANYILESGTLQFFYRERTCRVRPIVSIGGARFVSYSQTKFFTDALDALAENTAYQIKKFAVSDEESRIEIAIDTSTIAYTPVISIRASDLPGTSFSISAYAGIGKSKVYIRKSSSYHTEKFKQNGGAEYLLETDHNSAHNNLFQAIDQFRDAFAELENKTARFDSKMVNPIYKLLGKKKQVAVRERIDLFLTPGKEYNASFLFSTIVSKTYAPLDSKQDEEMALLYADLFNRMVGKSIICAKPKKL